MIEWIKDAEYLALVQEKHRDFLMSMFYADFSTAAKQAITEIEKFSKKIKKCLFM
ncbi:hypothetical protein JW935_20410 [candidate division KSB1 bacterium]|nr:hypothetical protein [candidate division KSB1 bacterium]